MLSDIQLNEAMLAGLYRQPLIPASKEDLEKAKEKPVSIVNASGVDIPYKFLGKNQRHIVMIVDFPHDVFLPEEHLKFISKMLEACKLNLGHVAILNRAASAVDINRLKKELQPEFLLLFGIEPVSIQLPLSFPHFKDQEYAGCNYLFTPPLNELNQDTDEGKLLKSKLWLCLKKMFGM